MLHYADGRSFAAGAASYLYRPAVAGDTTARIMLPVEINRIPILALVDTSAPYVVCTPEIAESLNLDPALALEAAELSWHGKLTGHLYLLPITLKAERGESLPVNATIFVPDVASAAAWAYERRPFVLGLGCLSKIRFAVDFEDDTFYFGRLGQV